jgi:hypothetical protein
MVASGPFGNVAYETTGFRLPSSRFPLNERSPRGFTPL